MDATAAKNVGARILGEVEEESLEELLNHLNKANLPHSQGHPPLHPQIPIPSLSSLISRYHHAEQSAPPPLLGVSGRSLPLLYHLVSTLIAEPHQYSVVIVDVDHLFEVSRLLGAFSSPSPSSPPAAAASAVSNDGLPARPEDLKHIYLYRPPRSSLCSSRADVLAHGPPQVQTQAYVKAAEQYMIYGAHASRHRVWWGTVVVGGSGGDVNSGWRGWLDVQRKEIDPFGMGLSAEEALANRERRHEMVMNRGWEGRSRVGVYSWGSGKAESENS